MRRFGPGTPYYMHIYHSQYASGLWAMCLMAHMVEFWYFLYKFFRSETGSGEISTRGID